MQVTLQRPKLRPDATPSIFPNVPSHYIPLSVRSKSSSRKPPKPRGNTAEPQISSRDVESSHTDIDLDPDLDAQAGPSCSMRAEELRADENTSSIEQSNTDELYSAETTFNAWDAFDDIVLPACTRFIATETKILAIMQLSNNKEPRVTAVKEIRTTRHSNEVRALVLGNEWSRQIVASVEELSVYASQFFESVFCQGVPPTSQSEMVKLVRHGEKNILNWWQSTHCTRRIVMKDVTICEKCILIRKAASY